MAVQDLGGPHSGVKATITPGDPMSRAMGQYGQGHSYDNMATMAGLPTSDPAGKMGPPVRDGKGGIKSNPKVGALGAGPNGSYGSERNYGIGGDNS